MLKDRPVEHKRKNSQIDLFYPSNYGIKLSEDKKSNPSKGKLKIINNQQSNQKDKNTRQKVKLSLDCQKTRSEGKNILKLISNSQKKIPKKQIVIQNIDEDCNQNIDTSNGVYYSKDPNNSEPDDEEYESFFQFGKKGRNSIQHQILQDNLNCLNMEEITEVPDTMSNERRYDYGNFYQFNTSHQNSLVNFSNKLQQQSIEEQATDEMKVPKRLNDNFFQKLNEKPKNIKQRKQKFPKNIVIEQTCTKETKNQIDMSSFIMENNSVKLRFLKNKKSQSREPIKKVEQQKSRSSLLSTKKSKNLLSKVNLQNKKSLSLKNEAKDMFKGWQKKTKSFQKSKQLSIKSKNGSNLLKVSKAGKIVNQVSGISNNMNIGDKILMIEQSQSKLQNQYKILWECVGQLWQNSRITRYISEKNKSDIIRLKQNQNHNDQKIIKLKSQIIDSISSARY